MNINLGIVMSTGLPLLGAHFPDAGTTEASRSAARIWCITVEPLARSRWVGVASIHHH